MSHQYERSASNGAHWITEAGGLEPGYGIYWSRSWDRARYDEDGKKQYYNGFEVKIADVSAACKAAYPDREYDVSQHGSSIYVYRVK